MPFKSKAQARAAFGGALGSEMKQKAEQWAHETPGGIKSLPAHAAKHPNRNLGKYLHSNTKKGK